MKFISLITLLSICGFSSATAQTTNNKINLYRAWVTLIDKPYHVQGTLHQLKDSSLFVSNYLIPVEYAEYDNPTLEIKISNIDIIEVRKKNRVGKIAVIGAVGGFAIGSLIGLAKGTDSNNTASQKALLGGVSLAIPGALVGMLVGSVKIVIPIEGKLLNYKNRKQELQIYTTR